jgi:hypothetical protein
MTNGSLPARAHSREHRQTMPVELIAFTADLRIQGQIPLADDRLSDMLNSVQRVVVRRAQVHDLVNGRPVQPADLAIPVGSIVAVLATGRRGAEARRRRTAVHRARVGMNRFVVSGMLHVPVAQDGRILSSDPTVVFAGRDLLVPLTDATITYDCGDDPTSEMAETILVSRSHARWIDLDDAAGGDDDQHVERERVYHAAMVKDFTGAT